MIFLIRFLTTLLTCAAHRVSSGRIIVNYELGKAWQEAVVVYFKAI